MRKNNKDQRTSLQIEQFEKREMLAADFLDAVIPESNIDGTDNNLENTEWGSTYEVLERLTTVEYADGFNAAGGENLASAREISNAVGAQEESILNDRGLTDIVWLFGQFIDHDITLSENAAPAESLDIDVPTGDIYFDPFGTGEQVITFNRTLYEGGTSPDDIREQVNEITAFIDGSVIYGSSEETTNSLRSFEGGRMLVSDGNLLPIGDDGFFEAGDIRANENIALTSMHTIWVREHNRIADELADADPNLSDEEIFQTARAIVRGELQAITFNEFLPALLGADAIERYSGYDSSVNPNIANEFSTAAYRFGHTMLSSELLRLNTDGTVADEGNILLQNAYFSPGEILEHGIASILQGFAANEAQEIDTKVVDDIRNFLFGPPGSGGLDLASLNIQRGRDHGLADYNQVRVDLGLQAVSSFADITSDVDLQQKLEAVYGSVDNIDLWIGGLAEDHVAGTSTGETFAAIITDQFARIRDGDRFWYENLFTGSLLEQIDSVTLADVIQRNSDVANLQDNIFFSEENQPKANHEPLVINIPRSNSEIRVVVRGGQVEVRSDGKVEQTLLLTDSYLVIKGTGRADNITLDFRDASASQLKRIVINAGGGHDRVRIVGVHADFNGKIRVNGQSGNDQIRARGVDAAIAMYGGAGRDTLMGGNMNDRLFGGGGNDRIMGGAGDDELCGGKGDDMLDGMDGNDRLAELLAADTVLNDQRMRNDRNETDRIRGMEAALFFNLQDRFDVDSMDFVGNVELRRRG